MRNITESLRLLCLIWKSLQGIWPSWFNDFSPNQLSWLFIFIFFIFFMLQGLLPHFFISQNKASLCPYNKKPTSLCSLKQHDFILTQTLVGGLCSSLITRLKGTWLPWQTNHVKGPCLICQRETALEGFGPTNEYSGFEVSYVCSELIGQK